MAVRSLTQSLLRWPEPEQVLHQVRLWAAQVAVEHPGLERGWPVRQLRAG
jgi:hypothetical protein